MPGRPKGAKSKPKVSPENILPSKTVNDENANPIPGSLPKKVKKSGARTAKKSADLQLYAHLVGPNIDFFPKSKLPQNKVVIQRFQALRDKLPKEKLSMLVNTLYEEVVNQIWIPARIFAEKEKVCKYRILSVIQKYNKFKHRHYKGGEDSPKNLSDFKAFLSQLCDLSPPNLKELLQKTWTMNKFWEDDWKFYLNMCEAKQVGFIAGKDIKLAGKEGDKDTRLSNHDRRKTKSDAQKRKLSAVVTGDEFDDGKDPEDKDEDPEVIYKQTKKKRKVILEIDPNKIVKQTASTTDRLGMSARQTAMTLACVVKAGGEDLSQVKVSKSGGHRQRKKARAIQGNNIMSSFAHSSTGFVLHYDTKLVNPKGRDTEDRAAVLYSGGEHKQPYLLGIPRFESSSGKDVETGVVAELDKYNIPIEDCVANCYDTTASN